MANIKQKISPCLWFDNEAEAAANFYISIFKNSKILDTTAFKSETPSNKPIGSVMSVVFELDGQQFMALNGGPEFTFSEAISLQVFCEDQAEIDYYWGKLSAVPEAEVCGWLKDKYGLSWQIVPADMAVLFQGDDPLKGERTMKAMLQMKKLDIDELRRA